jgi:nitrous oxide reductase
MNKNASPSKRRQFLVGATLGTAGAVAGAAALVTGQSPTTVVTALAPVKTTASGYHLSAHIQQYYDTTKL